MITTLPSINLYRLLYNIKKTGIQGRRARRRFAILKRDNFRCVNCGSTKELTISHKEPVRLPGRKRNCVSVFAFDNCKTLCVLCHIKEDSDDYEEMRIKSNVCGSEHHEMMG
jgi:5-methylcytosine-specific restriction endonuclease McrA